MGEGIDLQVIKLPEAKKGFVLLPKRWVVEQLRLGQSLPEIGPGLRSTTRDLGRAALRRLHNLDARQCRYDSSKF